MEKLSKKTVIFQDIIYENPYGVMCEQVSSI